MGRQCHKEDHWLRRRSLSHIQSSTIYNKLFGNIYSATKCTQRCKKIIRERLSLQGILRKGTNRKEEAHSDYVLSMMEWGKKGESIFKQLCFSGDKEFIWGGSKFIPMEHFIYNILDFKEDIIIGTSPDMKFISSDGVEIPIEIKTQVNTCARPWLGNPPASYAMQNCIQSFAMRTDKGIILRLKYKDNRIELNNHVEVQAWFITYDPAFMSNFLTLIKGIKEDIYFRHDKKYFTDGFMRNVDLFYFDCSLHSENILIEIEKKIRLLHW